jgi:hypothetical protein
MWWPCGPEKLYPQCLLRGGWHTPERTKTYLYVTTSGHPVVLETYDHNMHAPKWFAYTRHNKAVAVGDHIWQSCGFRNL